MYEMVLWRFNITRRLGTATYNDCKKSFYFLFHSALFQKCTLNKILRTSAQKEQIENNVFISSTERREQIKSFNIPSSQRE